MRTEDVYADWARRFILFHEKRHPKAMGAPEVEAFLTHLAVERKVSASTQNQAKAALLFLYKQVLGIDLPWLAEIVTAKASRRLPVVLTQREVRDLLLHLDGTMWLVASLLYGTGMRVLEALRLRVKDVEFERREIIVREGKGSKDRVTVLPENLIAPLQAQLQIARSRHAQDLAAGLGAVHMPDALAVKSPKSARSWAGNTCSRARSCRRIRAPVSDGVTTCSSSRFSAPSRRRRDARASSSRCLRTCCATASQRTCCNPATTFERCRSCSGTAMSPPR